MRLTLFASILAMSVSCSAVADDVTITSSNIRFVLHEATAFWSTNDLDTPQAIAVMTAIHQDGLIERSMVAVDGCGTSSGYLGFVDEEDFSVRNQSIWVKGGGIVKDSIALSICRMAYINDPLPSPDLPRTERL